MPFKLGPPPKATSPHVSKSMRGNVGKDTRPELALRKALWSRGLRGYRLHWKRIPGRPDVCYPKKETAIFVNGCFWHRCPFCKPKLPKSNSDFWRRKFQRNKERDKLKVERLKDLGWKVMTVWECQINKDIGLVVSRIARELDKKNKQ